ncbi:MAG: hypothetical protein ACW990_00075 [Promethearchaeota archaeon]|jgi:hypothetical protein
MRKWIFNKENAMKHQELENKFMKWLPKWYRKWLVGIAILLVLILISSVLFDVSPDLISLFVGGFMLGTMVDHIFFQRIWIAKYEQGEIRL